MKRNNMETRQARLQLIQQTCPLFPLAKIPSMKPEQLTSSQATKVSKIKYK